MSTVPAIDLWKSFWIQWNPQESIGILRYPLEHPNPIPVIQPLVIILASDFKNGSWDPRSYLLPPVQLIMLDNSQPQVIIRPILWSNLKEKLGKTLWSTISKLDQLTCLLISGNIMWPAMGPYWSVLANSIPMVIRWTKCRLGGYVGLGNPRALFRTELALSLWDMASGTLSRCSQCLPGT